MLFAAQDLSNVTPSHWGSTGSAFRNPYAAPGGFYSMKNDFDNYHYNDSVADSMYNGFPPFSVLQSGPGVHNFQQNCVQQTGSAFNIVSSNSGYTNNQANYAPQGTRNLRRD